MRRRLPVLQPTELERRWFLVGMAATALTGCASESTSAPRRSSSSSSGGSSSSSSSSSGGTDGGGVVVDDDGGVIDQPLPDGGGAAPIPDAGGGSSSGGACKDVGVDVGPASGFAMGTVKYVSAVGCYIGRDAGGLYAMYALCTHTIGNLSVGATQITCTVHGATFSLTGQVTKGPATQDLPHFEMCLNAKGNVAVNVKTIVPGATRLQA